MLNLPVHEQITLMNLRCSRFEVKVHHTQILQVAKKLDCESRQINFFTVLQHIIHQIERHIIQDYNHHQYQASSSPQFWVR